MLVSPNVEELFVFSTFFAYPLNRAILKYYMIQELQLLKHSLKVIPDPSTLKTIQKKIDDIGQVRNDLRDFFPNIEVKGEVFRRAHPRIGFVSNMHACRTLSRPDAKMAKQLKEKMIEKMGNELNNFDPLTVVATISVNMSKILDRDSLLGLEFFRTVWEHREPEEILSKMFSKKKFGPSIYEITGEIMKESYRQVLLTAVDIQRRIRKQMIELLSTGAGRKEMSFEGLLRLANLLLTSDSLERITYHLLIDIPIYIVEGRSLALFVPKMSTMESYPYHVAFDTQYKRLVAHYASSVEPQMSIPYLDLIKTRHENDFKNLVHIFELSTTDQPTIVPFSKIKDLKIDDSILETKYNPFVTIRNSDGKWLLTTSILVHDAFFRFVWSMRASEHFKRVGSSFEDSVAEYLSLKFPDFYLKKHVLFHIPGPGENIRKYEIDLLLRLGDTLICIECKDYVLIEDPDDFRQIAQRVGILEGDCSYFSAKIDSFIKYFSEFSQRYPEFAESKTLIPIVVAMHPELQTSYHRIPVMTKYELVRLLNSLIETDLKSLPLGIDLLFRDISGVALTYRILKIEKGARNEHLTKM